MNKSTLDELKARYKALDKDYLYEYLCNFESIEKAIPWLEDVLKSNPASKGNILEDPDSLSLSEAEMEVLSDSMGQNRKSIPVASNNIDKKFEEDLGWGNNLSDIQKGLNAKEQLLSDYNFIEELIENIYKKEPKKGQEPTTSDESKVEKPHKDAIYIKYGEFKSEVNGVDFAFDKICEWIEGEGHNVSDYIKTDTPQNFDRSYREWLKRKRKS